MATITDAKLSISHDHEKKLARCVVTCRVNFIPVESCLMKACPNVRWFRLKCQLWGSDSGLTGSDDFLYTYSAVRYYPDATPSTTESATFDVTLGEGDLDEDWGEDEVYGKLILVNLNTLVSVSNKTNTVHHSFQTQDRNACRLYKLFPPFFRNASSLQKSIYPNLIQLALHIGHRSDSPRRLLHSL